MIRKIGVGIAAWVVCLSLCAVACKSSQTQTEYSSLRGTSVVESSSQEENSTQSESASVESVQSESSSTETSIESSSTESSQSESASVESSAAESSSMESSIEETSSGEEESSSLHSHSFSTWDWDEDEHWKVCECGEEGERAGHAYGAESCACGKSAFVCEYVEEGGYYVLTDWLSTGDMVVPECYEGKPIQEIGAGAFYEKDIHSLRLPNSVTKIGDMAFFGCTALEKVTFGEGVETIGMNAFYLCTSLTEVEFAVTEGWYAGGRAIAGNALSVASTAAAYLRGEETEDGALSCFEWTRET